MRVFLAHKVYGAVRFAMPHITIFTVGDNMNSYLPDIKEVISMERFNTCELREKEVINVCNGARLGCPSDFEFNACDGRITALVIPKAGGFLGFGRAEDIIIPWCKIECIGADTILVKLSAEDYYDRERDRKKRKSFW